MKKLVSALSLALLCCLFAGRSASGQDKITMADLVGDWGFGHSLMMTYLDHGTGNYSHSGNIYGMKYIIKADGSFVYKFAGRYGAETIRGWGSGTVTIVRDTITFKFETGPAEKYQLVGRGADADGHSLLTVSQVNDGSHTLRCGHDKGHFDCTGRQDWVLRKH